jgi:aldose 1-epimerase
MNVLKRYIFGIGLLSLALISVQCKNDKKMDDTTVSSDKKATAEELHI